MLHEIHIGIAIGLWSRSGVVLLLVLELDLVLCSTYLWVGPLSKFNVQKWKYTATGLVGGNKMQS